MGHSIDIRRLDISDSDLASQAIRTLKSEAESTDSLSVDSASMKQWLENPANILIVAAAQNAMAVGFALGYVLDRVDCPQPMLCFYELVVAPNQRRKGIGRKLVEAMKRVADQSHARKMWVQTDPDNHAARALYKSAGGIESATPDHVYSWTEGNFSEPIEVSS